MIAENKDELQVQITRLVTIMEELREKCPWDKKQSFVSLQSLSIEELYELIDAIRKQDYEAIKEEMGDLMLHLVFYSVLAREASQFNLNDVINALCEKLIYRHPHIYSDTIADTEEEVRKNWEQLKKAKKQDKGLLSGVPNSLPELVKAWRMQEKAKTVGFEWDNIDQVLDKVLEEIAELKEAVLHKEQSQIEMEFGDVLFSLINYGRFLNVDPEIALSKVNQKFKSRFEYIEANAPKSLDQMSLEEMELLWQSAKEVEIEK